MFFFKKQTQTDRKIVAALMLTNLQLARTVQADAHFKKLHTIPSKIYGNMTVYGAQFGSVSILAWKDDDDMWEAKVIYL